MNAAHSRSFIDPMDQPESVGPPSAFVNNIPSDLSGILRDYLTAEDKKKGIQSEEAILIGLLSDEKEEVPPFCAWNPSLKFFDGLDVRATALKTATARAFIAGNVPAGLALVRNNPWLLRAEMEGTVVMGERSITLKGTPLQILARLGDFNPIEREEKEEPIGGVEQLLALDIPTGDGLAGHLTADEIESQLNAVFPPGWDSEDGMDSLKATVEELVSEIEALNIDHEAPWNVIQPLTEDIIRRFRTTIFHLPTPTSGFVFDQRIFPWFIDRFWGNDGKRGWGKRLGHEWSTKSDLLLVAGLGSLQAADTPCGLQFHRQGVYKVVADKVVPDRSIHFSAAPPSFYSGLGLSSFLSLYNARGDGVRWGRFFRKCCQTKTADLQKFMRTPARPHPQSSCVIL